MGDRVESLAVLSQCYPRGTTTVADGLGLGQWQVCLGAGWRWLCVTWGKLLVISHRGHPCSPPATKILPCKRNTEKHTFVLLVKKRRLVR